MTIARAKTLGWVDGEIFTATQANTMDTNLTYCLDGNAGGTYAPSAILQLNGEGLGVGSMFESTGFTPTFGLQNWKHTPIAKAGTNTPNDVAHFNDYNIWISVGGTDGCHISTDDADSWLAYVGGMAGSFTLRSVAVDQNSNVAVAVGDSATVYRLTSVGVGSWTTATAPSSPTNLRTVRYISGSDTLVAVGNVVAPDPYIATSTDAGANWTSRTAPAGFAGKSLGSLAVNQTATAVCAATTAHTKIAVSTDSGVTWADSATTLTSAIYFVGYNAALGKFMAVPSVAGPTANVYTSTDGSTWTVVCATNPASFDMLAGSSFVGHNVVGYGRAWVVLGNLSASIQYTGAAYSIDGGVTWKFVLISDRAGTSNCVSLGADTGQNKCVAQTGNGYVFHCMRRSQ